MNLTEATMLAIQGKLKLDESKEVKKESIDVSVDDNGATIVETPEATVIVTDTQNVTEAPVEEVIVAEIPEEEEVATVEIPVEGDETIIPEEIVEPETTEEVPTIDEIVDGETEEDLEESKKVEAKVTEYIDEEDLDKAVKEAIKNCINYEAIEDMLLKVSTEGNGYTDFDTTYKVIKGDDNKFYAYEINDKNEKIGDEIYLFESKSIKTEAIAQEGNCTFALKIECVNDAFGGIDEDGGADQEAMQVEVARILKDIADKVANGDYSNDSNILDANGNVVGKYGFGFEGVQDPFTESKKVEENVEIEVSEDGKEVEVKTDEGENVEVIDETEEPETSDEAAEEIVEVPEEEKSEEDDSEFIEESFEKALTEYYKENTKSIKGYKIEKISKEDNSIKIEGLLTNKLNKSVKTELKANKVQEGKFYSRYEIAGIKGLLESKTSTDACMIVKTTKENKLECSSLANKKLVK